MRRTATWGIAALLVCSGCSGSDDEPASKASYQVVFQALPSALISVWGSSAADVWSVGGDDGTGPLVVHYDGGAWQRHSTGTNGDLWWVHGFAQGPVFMGGEGGVVSKYEAGAFELLTTPSTATVFGIWGTSPTDVWAVGGNGTDGAFAWRYDGTAWSDFALPAEVVAGASLFKVWGRSADDVWMVGSGGTALHWNGTALETTSTGTTRTLFTVHGDAMRTIAVGGFGDGLILEHDGNAWADVTPSSGSAKVQRVVGVCATSAGIYAAGDYGSVLKRGDAGWTKVTTGLEVFETFHAVWVDEAGAPWAVGGQVDSLPLTDGVMIHGGKPVKKGSL